MTTSVHKAGFDNRVQSADLGIDAYPRLFVSCVESNRGTQASTRISPPSVADNASEQAGHCPANVFLTDLRRSALRTRSDRAGVAPRSEVRTAHFNSVRLPPRLLERSDA